MKEEVSAGIILFNDNEDRKFLLLNYPSKHWDFVKGKMEKDEFQFLNHDLGVEAKTDIDFITKWLRKRRKGISVVFTTYQSGKVIAEASRNANKVFDLGIMDEAHKTVGDKDKPMSSTKHPVEIKPFLSAIFISSL